MEKKIGRSVSDFNSELKLKGFNVFQIESDGAATRIYSRKDFYKICITTEKSAINYADRSFETEGTVLFFGNPIFLIPRKPYPLVMLAIQCFFRKIF